MINQIARPVVVLIALLQRADRPLLASASVLLAESASCFMRSAAFESLAKTGTMLEGTRGKLRCQGSFACELPRLLAIQYPYNSHLLASVWLSVFCLMTLEV
jgi:hypothetical protein